MRIALIVIGLALLVAGIWVVFGHASYQTTDTLVQFGSAKLTATHDQPVPRWLGFFGISFGAFLATRGLMKKG
jgi:hypothetical protein